MHLCQYMALGPKMEQGEEENAPVLANESYRELLKDRKRIVVKVGSSSLIHAATGRLDYRRIDRLTRELADLKNQGKEVILVSSGAAAAGREALQINIEIYRKESPMNIKQACAAVGQARLIQIYQKFFEEYNQLTAQVLMERITVTDEGSRKNLQNTFEELLRLGVIPIVNENDSVATQEFAVGDNDNLSAIVAAITGADLLILLSDVDGLYTDDPRTCADASFIPFVSKLDEKLLGMGKNSTGSGAGTGGMSTKLHAGLIATGSGCDMVICNAGRGMDVIHEVMEGENIGTLFVGRYDPDFDLYKYIESIDA